MRASIGVVRGSAFACVRPARRAFREQQPRLARGDYASSGRAFREHSAVQAFTCGIEPRKAVSALRRVTVSPLSAIEAVRCMLACGVRLHVLLFLVLQPLALATCTFPTKFMWANDEPSLNIKSCQR